MAAVISSKRTLYRLYVVASVIIILVALMASIAAVGPRFNDLSTIVSSDEFLMYRGQPTPAMVESLDEIGWSMKTWAIYMTTLESLLGVSAISVALFIIWKSQHNCFALWMAVSLATGNTGAVFTLQVLQETHPGWALPIQLLRILGFIGYGGAFVLFPNGRFVPAWTRRLGFIWVAYVVISVFITPEWRFAGTLDFVDTPQEALKTLGVTLLLVSGIAFQVYRYFWRSTQLERQQTKWVVFSLSCFLMAVIPLPIGALLSPDLVLGPSETASGILFQIVYLSIIHVIAIFVPVAIAFAILRYRLWDIDLIINRTLIYGILSVLIVSIYVVLVGGLSALFNASGVQIFSLLSTGIVAISFYSLRDWVQRSVNRLMFGQRDEPHTVLMELSSRLSTALLPQDLLKTSLETIGITLKLPYVAITIRRGEIHMMQAEYGTNRTLVHIFPLIYQNETMGELLVSQRSPNESLNPADQMVIAGIAQQMGAVAYAVRLQSDLQAARERLVITREEERRRLRRDLHDGIGPALASLPLKIDAAVDLIPLDQQRAVSLLEDVKRQSQQLVAEVRQIVHNLRPSALDELGLVEALRSALAQIGTHPNSLQITLTADLLPSLPAAVEAATYRITMEAVTNVIKHAQARHCWITLQRIAHPPQMQIAIEDDGIGLSHGIVPNVGLNSMRERAEELGGTFLLQNRPSSGTRITVLLPLSEMSAVP